MAQIVNLEEMKLAKLNAAAMQATEPRKEARYLSCADTAKLVRAALKEAFPGVKFSVTSSVYSGGASIDVKWTDGPTTAEVDAVAKRFEGATFDGMIDLKSYHESEVNGERVRFGADFVMTDRDLSPELLTRCAEAIAKQYGVAAPKVETSTWTHRGKTHTSAHLKQDYESLLPDGEGLNRTAADRALRLAYATSCYATPTAPTPEPPTTPEPTTKEAAQEVTEQATGEAAQDAPYTCPFCGRVVEPVTCEACDGLACDDCLIQQYDAGCGFLCVCPKCAGADDEPPTPPTGPSVYEQNADLYNETPEDETGAPESAPTAPVDVPEGAAIARRDPTSHTLWLEFDGKPDEATRATLKADGWRWSGYRKQWYTNRRWAQVPASIPHVDAGECDYAAERADRLSERAEKHATKSAAAYQKSHDAVAHIPLGQPILVGHHSERGHRRDLARSWAAMDKSVAEAKTAKRLDYVATSSAAHQAYKQTPEAMQRRVDRLSAEHRKMLRNPWTGAHAQEWQRRVDVLAAEIADLQQRIADAGGIKADQLAAAGMAAQVGDTVRIHGFVGVVVRVNPKTYTVKMNHDGWTLKLDRTRLQEIIARKSDA